MTASESIAARPPLLSDTFNPQPMSRRSLLGGAGAGAAGAAAAAMMPRHAWAAIPDGFDTMDPETNLKILMKLQADLAEEEIISGFPGKAWMWIPDENNYLAFQTYGIGTTLLKDQGNGVWNFHHREILYYMDPVTG